ncbi:glycosyltransferase [Arthrospiribacter ruber]|uniref:Glycosyltransferase n=1 Tax=Arthrospiribacter ruber TaxID=2487934 RepID=A0A951IPT4_9BACT|nr:glycosyltransferase [Arthrospiribacter ruber]MBW3466325.1 glycosyltransferase [Arthrospiribacter ruber]
MEYLGSDKPISKIQPTVSVLVSTFQHVDFISTCLDSILSQKTNFAFEIIVGEDASTDGTRAICIEYAEKYPDKIRLFLRKEEDKIFIKGKKVGRFNHLENFKCARGKYLAYCDGDDYWIDENKLQLQFDLMEKNPEANLCLTNTLLEKSSGESAKPLVDTFSIKSPKELRNVAYLGHISSWFFKNDMNDFLNNKITRKAPVMDVILFVYLKNRGKVISTPETTSFYRYNRNGLYRLKSVKKVHMERFTLNWLIFIYLHRNPALFLRNFTYLLWRYYLNFMK